MKVFALTVQQKTDLNNKILTLLGEGPKSLEELEQSIPEAAELKPPGRVKACVGDLFRTGYIYPVGSNYFALGQHGVGAMQAGNLGEAPPSVLYSSHAEEDIDDFVVTIKPYYEYFKKNHPEYSRLYSALDSKKNYFTEFSATVLQSLRRSQVKKDDLFTGETSYEAPPNLVTIEHAIFEAVVRTMRYMDEFKSMNLPDPETLVATNRFMKSFFKDNGEYLARNVLVNNAVKKPGLVLSMVDIDKTIAALEKGGIVNNSIDKVSLKSAIYNWLLARTNEGSYGVFLQDTGVDSIEFGLREFLENEKANGSAILTNFRTTYKPSKEAESNTEHILSKVFSGSTFSGVSFVKGNFVGLTITGAKFLDECDFSGAVFTNAIITHCDFSGASFVSAVMDVDTFSDNTINGTNFRKVTGLDGEDVGFRNNAGKPINLKLTRRVVDTDTYNKLSEKVGRTYHNRLPFHEDERSIVEILLDGLHRLLVNRGGKKSASLKFSAGEDLNELKSQLMEVYNSKGASKPAEWMQNPETAKAKLVELNRSGVLKEIGLSELMGKLMGFLASRPKEKVVDPLDPIREGVNAFVDANAGKPDVLKSDLLSIIPPTARHLRAIIDGITMRDKLTEKDLASIYSTLIESVYTGESIFLSKQESVLSTFPHSIRVSDMHQDRSSGDYRSSYKDTFGVLVEPYTRGMPENVKFIIDKFMTSLHGSEAASGWSAHWNRAISSARVRPVSIQEYGTQNNKSMSIWEAYEFQSDPLQHADSAWSLFGFTGDIPISGDKLELNRLFRVLYGLAPQKNQKVSIDIIVEQYDKQYHATIDTSAAVNNLESAPAIIGCDGLYAWIKNEKEAFAVKAVQDLRNYYRDWPEVTIIATIRKALEHGNVDEVWVPTAEDYMKGKNVNRAAQYDEPVKRLGGVRFSPSFEIPGAGSEIFKFGGPKTWYKVDLTPYKLNLKEGDRVTSKQDGSVIATILNIDKFNKFDKPQYTPVTPREDIVSTYKDPFDEKMKESRDAIVYVYRLSSHKGNDLFVSLPRDFVDHFLVEKRFSNISLRFSPMNKNLLSFGSTPVTGKLLNKKSASQYADSVFEYAHNVKKKNPYLEQVPEPLILSSGVAARRSQNGWEEHTVIDLLEELHQAGYVVYRPIRNYVHAIINIINKKIPKNIQRIVQNTGEPVAKIGKELMQSWIQAHAADWGVEEKEHVIEICQGIATNVIYPNIQARDPFASGQRGGEAVGPAGEPIDEGTAPKTEKPLPEEAPIPGLSFVKPTGDELQEYHKEYETRLYDRLKKAFDEGSSEKVQRLHKMISVLVSGSSSKKKEEYTNRLLDWMNEFSADPQKVALVKGLLSSLQTKSSLKFNSLKFS